MRQLQFGLCESAAELILPQLHTILQIRPHCRHLDAHVSAGPRARLGRGREGPEDGVELAREAV